MQFTSRATRGLVFLFFVALSCALLAVTSYAAQKTEIKGIRYWTGPEHTRVVIDLTEDTVFSENRVGNPERVYIDLSRSVLPPDIQDTISVSDSALRGVRAAQYDQNTVRVVLDLNDVEGYRVFRLSSPTRVVIDVFPTAAPAPRVETVRQEATDPAEEARRVSINRLAEDKARQVAEARRLAEERKNEAEAQRLAEEKRVAQEQKLAEERMRVEEAARLAEAARREEQKRLAEEKRIAQEQKRAQEQRIAEEKRLAEERKLAEGQEELAREQAQVRDEKLARVKKTAELKEIFKPHTRVVVIDAGHGGHDPGAIGPGGIKEKDIVLDVAKRLKRKLEASGNYEVHLTRDSDKYLSLEARTMVANNMKADLFISVHANANKSKNARGLETYFLNYTNEKEAIRVAARENKISVRRMQHQRTEKDVILASLQLDNNVHESRRLANYVQGSMVAQVDRRYKSVRNLGVKNALFYVLVGARMPSALVEVSFITNPIESKRLKSPTYRDNLAQGIASGVDKYFKTLPPEQKIAMRQ
jgi:N-acetylmuramoyl-L-alanine amidase